MVPFCLETKNLTHRFSKQEIILDSVNLKIGEGSIYGFLGPNGAGKTTTLRLVLGLLKKQQGDIYFFGIPFIQNRLSILKRVGSLIESPSLYAHLTAQENLLLLQKIYKCPRQRIREVLNQVGLAHTGNKKISQFSLGMKQRLSIAIALLHTPSLLILDEPTNGLDPNGIIEIRELLTTLNHQQGITIIISSHLLSEIEKLVTHVGIINKGRMMFQGTLQELKDKQQQASVWMLETSNPDKVLQIISSNNWSAQLVSGKMVISHISKDKIALINRQLVAHGIEVYEISMVKNDLETIFMDFINDPIL
ncbi:MAG: ABC transporter ATP-binding protein [Bacteroidetes bacterium]|nr:ABC transporter ATP-binding protein [Bacteroidota bacterium]